MSKRKRNAEPEQAKSISNGDAATKIARLNGQSDVKTPGPVIQIVTGSYERVLHGITASLSDISSLIPSTQFANSFLFNAHASAIRCLAISPLSGEEEPHSRSVYLATGGSDERVNVYSLSASPMIENDKLPVMPSIGNNKISENPGNREMGTLMHHSSNVTALHFPTRSKLLSASEDNSIAISRTRDLSVVSTIKAPRPKAIGQPSGDTAPVGATPAGVNDFAIHPSMKLMISVGKGEKCMRLWNLVTGRKAGVLNFERNVLLAVKESKYSSGEGRKIRWNAAGNEFAVAFERGVAVFGEDSKPKCFGLPQPLTKVHQIAYFSIDQTHSMLAVSTEDGRLVFYNTTKETSDTQDLPPSATATAQLGGRSSGVSGRIKDFKLLRTITDEEGLGAVIAVTANSDGSIKVWWIKPSELSLTGDHQSIKQIGTLIGSYETGSRITCMDAFVMMAANEDTVGLSEYEGLTEEEAESGSSSDDD